jgi:hypothetical protein
MILNIKLSLNILAPILDPTKKSIIPFIIKDAPVSPGCTLELIIIAFLFFND